MSGARGGVSYDRSRQVRFTGGRGPGTWREKLARLVLFLGLTGLTGIVFGVLGLYLIFSKGLPEIPRVDRYWPPVHSQVFTSDAVLAGEIFNGNNERRKVVPYERIPKRLVQAFIASEDSSFFEHGGLDVLGTTRAAIQTIRKKVGLGGSTQGGSTLTQQTAKAVLTGAEGYKAATAKTLVRKIREAILARRLEEALTKEEILYLYLNNVYLGHSSYGVQSAAENYFRKDVSQMSLAEMSLIAGLPQAPSSYSPYRRYEAAKKRRTYVLRRMRAENMISEAEREEADRTDVKVYALENVFHEFAPYFTEQVRRQLNDRYGSRLVQNEGLQVFTTMDSEKQRAAQDSMLDGLLAVDKRQGFRGPIAHMKSAEQRKNFIAKATTAMAGEKIQLGRYYVALVTGMDDRGELLDVQVGAVKGKLPLLGMRWARKVNPEGYYPGMMLTSAKSALKVGDVVIARAVEKKQLTDDREQFDGRLDKIVPETSQLFRLEQEPELQGALVSIDPQRAYLVAMVGGYDFDANEYNRAFQACRQPGSSFKPLVYAAAIEQLGWTEGTVLVDSPIVFDDPTSQMRWKPENYSSEFAGDVIVRTALVNSMNIPAVKTFQAVGVKNMSAWSKRLGLSTPMNEDFSAALGSSCVYPFELAQVYATFNRYGLQRPTHFIRKIEDRFGRTMEDHTAFDDPWAPYPDRVAAGFANLFEQGEQVMAPETGFVVTDLLRGVVQEGTGAAAQRLGKPAAGKTGTTNDSFDAWFAGFTKDLVTVVWVGYDMNVHPLGKYETGGRASLPIWLSYMKRALDGRPQGEFGPPPDVEMVRLAIDTKTGKKAGGGGKGVRELWFKKGTEPSERAPDKGQVDTSTNFMSIP